MMMFKACPRCTGDMHGSSDQYGRYLACVQCGFNFDVPPQGSRVAKPREETLAQEVAA